MKDSEINSNNQVITNKIIFQLICSSTLTIMQKRNLSVERKICSLLFTYKIFQKMLIKKKTFGWKHLRLTLNGNHRRERSDGRAETQISTVLLKNYSSLDVSFQTSKL